MICSSESGIFKHETTHFPNVDDDYFCKECTSKMFDGIKRLLVSNFYRSQKRGMEKILYSCSTFTPENISVYFEMCVDKGILSILLNNAASCANDINIDEADRYCELSLNSLSAIILFLECLSIRSEWKDVEKSLENVKDYLIVPAMTVISRLEKDEYATMALKILSLLCRFSKFSYFMLDKTDLFATTLVRMKNYGKKNLSWTRSRVEGDNVCSCAKLLGYLSPVTYDDHAREALPHLWIICKQLYHRYFKLSRRINSRIIVFRSKIEEENVQSSMNYILQTFSQFSQFFQLKLRRELLIDSGIFMFVVEEVLPSLLSNMETSIKNYLSLNHCLGIIFNMLDEPDVEVNDFFQNGSGINLLLDCFDFFYKFFLDTQQHNVSRPQLLRFGFYNYLIGSVSRLASSTIGTGGGEDEISISLKTFRACRERDFFPRLQEIMQRDDNHTVVIQKKQMTRNLRYVLQRIVRTDLCVLLFCKFIISFSGNMEIFRTLVDQNGVFVSMLFGYLTKTKSVECVWYCLKSLLVILDECIRDEYFEMRNMLSSERLNFLRSGSNIPALIRSLEEDRKHHEEDEYYSGEDEDDELHLQVVFIQAEIANKIEEMECRKRLRRTTCCVCGKKSEELKRCSSCKKRFYCGRDCQMIDWIKHKNECLDLRNMKYSRKDGSKKKLFLTDK